MSREYKDSGIEWIGQIPKEWRIGKIKNFYSLQTGFTPDTKNELYYDDQGALWANIADIGREHYIDDTKKKISNLFISKYNPNIVPKGSLLYSFKLSVGSVAITAKDMYTNEAIAAFIKKDDISLDFLYYSSQVCVIFNANENIYGAKILNQDLINNAIIIFPPLNEQQKIADYLDKVCGEADEMIVLQEKMIEELKAYKQSVITEAVTKGLNPNVPMKDSGIDWIGEIPEHWRKSAIKHIITKIESGVSVNAELIKAENNELGVLKTSSVSSNYFIPSENKRVDLEEYNRVSCPVKADTIIVSRMNTPELVGAAGYCSQDIPTIFLPDRLWQVHFDKSKLYVKFGWYYLISSPIKAYYSSLSSGTSSSMQNISQPQFCQAFFLLPPIYEQQQIASFLDAKCSDIDSLIAVKQTKIGELKEYKKSVIYEYVTGKKEVV